MDEENNPIKKIKINLDLSLALRPLEEEEAEVAERPSQFTQFLRSVSEPPPNVQPSPPPLHHMTPSQEYTSVITHRNLSGAALPPSPPLGFVSVAAPSPYPLSGQFLQPHQVNHGSGPMENPWPVIPRQGRPPAGPSVRRNTSRAVAVEKNVGDKEIIPPYPWATTQPALNHNLRYLCSNNINVISGQVHCRPCDQIDTLEYNLKEKFAELYRYINASKEGLRQRAPHMWMYPKLTPCGSCESGMKPIISDNKEEINWLFLLLGQMLGCCTLEQLRYFCDKTSQHRTGAKDRVLYLTYLGLCKQLRPSEKLFSM